MTSGQHLVPACTAEQLCLALLDAIDARSALHATNLRPAARVAATAAAAVSRGGGNMYGTSRSWCLSALECQQPALSSR
jgi:hypothetical protein